VDPSVSQPTPANRFSLITDGLPNQLPDVDPQETAEWLESLDAVVDEQGRRRARYLMLRLLERARERAVGVPALRSTDYVNTIAAEAEPWFPGDEHVERRIRAYIRWNAAILVSRANRPEIGVADTSRRTPARRRSTRSASITSSAARTTASPATRFTSRATAPPAFTPGPTWRAG